MANQPVITPEFRAGFVALFQPSTNTNTDGTVTKSYSITAFFPPTADLKALKSLAGAVAGNVKFRIIEDMNDNGRWDTGNLVERRQPERAEYYMDDKNIDTFAAKENWEVELTIDMNKVFAPVTMQSLAELLEKREALRLQKVLEERAKNPRRNTNSNTSNTTSTMGGGFNSGMNTMMNGLR